jgi:AraC-like DNA-binding protein
MKQSITTLFLSILMLTCLKGQQLIRLELPNHEQLSSERVSQVIQDSEGYLWYATEGGGICRDDGNQMLVFRSDAEHPDLLGSNDVACLAEAAGRFIIIGTYHGASVLDKHDYSIHRLDDVDDKRVDDILIDRNGHWWLTSNKKLYEYSADGQLMNIYLGGDKYIFRLYEDQQGRLWGTEWEGGTLRLDEGRLVQISTEWPDNINFSRVTNDHRNRQLVADGFGACYALSSSEQQSWFNGQILTRIMADSIRRARGLSARPTAIAIFHSPLEEEDDKGDDELWFSTGKDIRRIKRGEEIVILSDTKDVSAMTFTADGTLWLATIFGTLMTYKDGQLSTDDYASNEYGEAVTHLDNDSLGRLILVSDRYIRLYDPIRRTLRQQSREAVGVYSIELQETAPNSRWSQPEDHSVVERIPQWGWLILSTLFVVLLVLSIHIWLLHRQRKRFLTAMKKAVTVSVEPTDSQTANEHSAFSEKWLQDAIAQVETHLSDDSYSVERLASDLCMSRMTFYRKIQSATGQKPTEFMRTIRLRRAAEMLREGHMTITEISYAAGFSSVSYFSRCFRTIYGVPPTQFGKTTTADERKPNENPS